MGEMEGTGERDRGARGGESGGGGRGEREEGGGGNAAKVMNKLEKQNKIRLVVYLRYCIGEVQSAPRNCA